MIEQWHHDHADKLLTAVGWGGDKSPEWRAGLHNAVAWYLAEQPLGHGRSTCPYDVKTAQRDAWLDGWHFGQARCLEEGREALLGAFGATISR